MPGKGAVVTYAVIHQLETIAKAKLDCLMGMFPIRGWLLGSNDLTFLQEIIYRKWVKSCVYTAIYHKHMLTTSI